MKQLSTTDVKHVAGGIDQGSNIVTGVLFGAVFCPVGAVIGAATGMLASLGAKDTPKTMLPATLS